MTVKNISILGSTGSIGTQTLEIVSEHPELFNVVALASNSNIDLLAKQAKQYQPELVVINEKYLLQELKSKLKSEGLKDIQVEAGEPGLNKAATLSSADQVVVSVVGFSGVVPTLRAIQSGKDISLANKETLVAAGQLVMDAVQRHNINLVPIDSEHSAIYQSLLGEDVNCVQRLILTASGGPFNGKTREELQSVKPFHALKHPNWDMGSKITIDSATLMNKGLEVIEAHWLFQIAYDYIDVVIHPQSIVHSLVEFVDGAVKAELGEPDMKVPIQYALGYPRRISNNLSGLDLAGTELTFDHPDTETFECLSLAYRAGKTGGSMPCAMNAANEMAVQLFLQEKIPFMKIPELISEVMSEHRVINNPSVDDLISIDQWGRQSVLDKLNEDIKGV